MTRHSFGGGTADFVQEVDNQGVVHAGNGATCTFYTAQTGGTAIVDLTDLANNPITSVSADANGGVPPFMGPNDGTSAMWVSAGGSARQLMQATDIPARIIVLEAAGPGGGGGGTVTSVNGKSPVSGVVTLVPADIGADVAGAASTAQTNAIAASMQRASNGSDIVSPPAFRTALGLGTAATQNSTAFDTAGAAATAQSNAIAASDPSGSAATAQANAIAASDAAGAAATAQANAIAASEPLLKVVTKSANYTGAAQEFVNFDLTSGSLTYTFPNNAPNNAVVGVKIVVQPSTLSIINLVCQGTDVIDVAGGSTTSTVKLFGQGKTYKYNSTTKVWTTIGDDLPLSQTDLRYSPKFLANTFGSAMTGQGTLDPVRGIYQPQGAKLVNLRARLAAAAAGTGIAELVFIGPSTTMGAVVGVSQSPATALVKALMAEGIPAQQGWANTAYSTSAPNASSNDPRWTYPDGSWTIFQTSTPYIAGAFTGTSGRRAIFTSTEKGTVVEFMVLGASGPYNYSIDGAAPVTVGAQGSSTYTTPVVVTGLSYGIHTLSIAPTTSALVYLAKARVRNTTGVIVNNAGFSGAAAEDWDKTDSTMSGYPGNVFALPYLAGLGMQGTPIYVIDCAFILNSYINSSGHTSGYTTAAATATLGRVIDQCRVAGGDVILLNPAAPSTTVGFGANPAIADATYEPYRQVMYTVADTKSCFLIDEVERTGLWATANTNGLEYTDGFHKTAAGYSSIADALDNFLALTPPAPAFLSIAPVQRGVWAPNTAYGYNDLVINPTGDLVTPVVPFVSGASYNAVNWVILVPAQNYGRELAGIESGTDFNLLPVTGVWTDIPGMSMTIPAGIAYTLQMNALGASLQGTQAAGTITGIQLRCVDAATATTVYGFAWAQFEFPVAGQSMTRWGGFQGFRRNAALGASTAVKMQGIAATATGAGNIGLFPASGGGTMPTAMQAIGR